MNLGLSKKEFLAMSPREFHALHQCYNERMEHLEWQMAGWKSVYANIHGIKVSAGEFMGKKGKAQKERNDKDLESSLTALFGVGPGREK